MKLNISSLLIFFSYLVTLDDVFAQICSNKYFKLNTTYDLNRRLVLSSLASNVKTHKGLYNSSIGQNPNRIFIIGMCIPGTKPDTCSDCIKDASDGLLQSCPNQTKGYTWSDYCMVRYSSTYFSGALVLERSYYVPVPSNTGSINSNVTVFDIIGEDLMSRTITVAPSEAHGHKYYAADVASLTASKTMYAMMQCTPDVSPGYCGLCLRTNLDDYKSCCRDIQGGSVLRPSCFIRWDSHPFAGAFENITLPPPQPPPSLTPPVRHRAQTTAKDRATISTGTIVAIVVPTVVILVLLFVGFVVCRTRKLHQKDRVQVGNETTTIQSLQFSFKTIADATDSFSESNMIGRGGFGEVYRGTLSTGTEVAVKRLSKTSGQGSQEFKNEAVLVSKLQHRNLVRLLGFCLEGEEKILVYEFVPNKSLDYFLFDPAKQGELDWKKRCNIIGGIARGMLYLHQDSRLTIIHRDLKVSNILLDVDMKPKIADFGMARRFGAHQTHADTRIIVGTYGYMSPEYAMRGQFSIKSDVYSFGVIILEIICGKRNSSLCGIDDSASNLITHAWRNWRNGSELVDPTIGETFEINEAIRCIHIALLCVQENPADRPTFSAIILMLTSSTTTLPMPKEPGFFFSDMGDSSSQSNSMSILCSTNDVSITDLDPC